MATIPGYLLVTAGDSLAVFNVSASLRRPPKLLLHQALRPLLQKFAPAQSGAQLEGEEEGEQQQARSALLAASQAHVAVMLNGSVLAMYVVQLPYRAPAPPFKSSLAWLQVGRRGYVLGLRGGKKRVEG